MLSGVQVEEVQNNYSFWRTSMVKFYGPQRTNLPNFHAITHLKQSMDQYGSPRLIYCEPYERKHKGIKKYDKIASNKDYLLYAMEMEVILQFFRTPQGKKFII